ncbi:BapA prefix-like domain-containing protein [Leclercia sp. S52]|uniref:BapA/Bap/LapF family prefix-like domain-containing protein n=1 Tax=Leclercia sp. S52 TaxID=3138178 RepID=UPI00321952CC
MSKITVISKLTHVETVTDGSQVTLADSSIVKINAQRADILDYERSGNDLIVKLADGETLTLKNFFVAGEQGISQLVLEESNGALWWIADPMAAESYQSIASVDALLAGTTTASAGEAAIWPQVVAAAAVVVGVTVIMAVAMEVAVTGVMAMAVTRRCRAPIRTTPRLRAQRPTSDFQPMAPSLAGAPKPTASSPSPMPTAM